MGIAIGIIIVFWGFLMFAQQTGLITEQVEVWPLALIIFGVLILVGAIYGMSRRPPS